MATLKYKTNNGYVPLPTQVVRKTNEENGFGIGVCSTAAATAAKEVAITNYELVKNGFVAIRFTYDVPANATLNINSKGAKAIYYKGSAIEADTIKADDTVMFAYDGTNYVLISSGEATETIQWITGHIIIDQTSSDPTTMVLDENNHSYSNYQRPAVITAIRNASHRYVGTFANNKMSLKQLDDTDGTKYADGTSAVTDIATQGKDVFMRLPYFFTRATTIATDKWKIEFAFSPNQIPTSRPDGNGWMKWGGNDLIGVYEALASSSSDDGNGGLYSVSGVTSSASISLENFKTKARNRGTGFTLIKWRHVNIMAILFFAYYGHTNSQEICGYGSNSNDKTTGLKNLFGMTDTTSATGNTDSINFWGLENWWGNRMETVDNVIANGQSFVVTEDSGDIRFLSDIFPTNGQWVTPTKLLLGNELDIVNTANGSSQTIGYCDGQYRNANTTSDFSLQHGGPNNDWIGGVVSIRITTNSTDSGSNISSRLAFTGTIEIV